tara:strand:+ start:222 stop:374 length:153 start_codon:yes stop_codon:yes gene_type:complete
MDKKNRTHRPNQRTRWKIKGLPKFVNKKCKAWQDLCYFASITKPSLLLHP